MAKDLQDYRTGEQLDLSTHAWKVIIVDAPVALPVLVGMQSLGYSYGKDDPVEGRALDQVLVIAGTFYWFFGGFFAGKLLLSPSTRTALLLGFTLTPALALFLWSGGGGLAVVFLLGVTPLLLAITHFLVQRTTLLKYERQATT